jgi:RecB family exonuclease
MLNPFEREVLLRKAAREASAAGAEPPFRIRSGLIVEILGLYDELRRRHRTVVDFDRLLMGALEPTASTDRGASRLLQQTVFLTETFTRFEGAVRATGLADEQTLRALALESQVPLYAHAIVAVGDQAADRHGLWTADFDLLARLPHLDRLDIVVTETMLATGLHERLHDLLPGIEEERFEAASAAPVLVVPDSKGWQEQSRVFVCRDREEELAGVARSIKDGSTRPARLDRRAVVFQRPLPYLYLARQVFADARVPYQALDALPLAAEPFAATVDVIFAAVSGDFTRAALIELLRSPHLRFSSGERRLDAGDIAALDRYLVDRKYLGRPERLAELAIEATPTTTKKWAPALRCAAEAAAELSRAIDEPSAPRQIDGLLQFFLTHEALPRREDPWYERHLRARGAVVSALEMLRDAHGAHDADPLSVAELAGAVRRWIESQTFSPRFGTHGLRLMDATAAAFADLDDVHIAGLVEGDWPERTNRSIFYPLSLLAPLGWPSEQDRLSGARARFHDLLTLAQRRVSLSTITLEDDGLVSPSALLDELDAAGLPMERQVAAVPSRAFIHEALAIEPVAASAVDGAAGDWLALRRSRRCDSDRFHGSIGARQPTAYAVSHVERYLECPFKYFAAYVLRLPEEREEQAWLTPQERGQFVHEVFCDFFDEWQRLGRGAITTANVADAVALFERVAEERLLALPEGDRALERTFLLGSAAAAGLAERAFAFEIEHGVDVVERLTEFELTGTFTFQAEGDPKRIEIRSKADRIDLLRDGTLRVVDYKLGRAPGRDRSLQLPVYGACACQALDGRHGQSWSVSRAGYVAFKEKQAFVPLGRSREDVEKALAEGQKRLVEAIAGIESGAFPVQPPEPFLCNWCPYPSVCRKDYVGDE